MSHSTTRLVVTPASAGLRRSLRPIEWVVLEDVALDARVDARSDARTDGAGILVAATSARRVAEHLGLTPGAAAKALAALRTAGLIAHNRPAGPAGRFGLSMYTLTLPPGLEVIQADVTLVVAGHPAGDSPRPAPPHVESPRAVDRHMAVAPAMSSAGGAETEAVESSRSARRQAADISNGPATGEGAGKGAASADRRRVTRSPRSTRRPLGDQRPAQLSLDLTDDAGDLQIGPRTGPQAMPRRTRATTTAPSPDQRRSARRDDAVAYPSSPDA